MRDKILDDLAGFASSAAGIVADAHAQFKADIQDRAQEMADKMELVSRDELQALEARIEALEAALAKQTTRAPKPRTKKAAK